MLPAFASIGVVVSVLSYFLKYTSGDEVIYTPKTLETTTLEEEEPSDEASENKAEQVIEYKCSRCSAPVDFEEDSTKTKCEHCGARLHRQWRK
jgi:DNA-directed RNA polymerase subunit RPC12/RpoP